MEEVIGMAGIRFSYDALIKLTDDFSDENTIVKTHNFDIFRAQIDKHSDHLTVKIWHSHDKLDRFKEEVAILCHPRVLNCPNIVKLIGYCCEGDRVGSVYKLQSVDTLENLLDKDEFQWRDRMITALGIARIFRFFGVSRINHRIHATLPCCIILDQGSNPVLCDLRVLSGGIMTLNEGSEDSAAGNDACFFGEDVTTGPMKPNGIFALGILLLRLVRERRNVLEDVKTKLPYVGCPNINIFTSVAPLNSHLKCHRSFYQCDCYTVTSLADQCLKYDERCPKISEVIQKLENLLLFSLPVRTSSGKVAVGGCTLVYYTYSDLCELTDNFSMKNLFAVTQFGEAYRGRVQLGWKEMGAQDIIVKMWGKLNFSEDGRVSKKCSSLEDNLCRLRDEVVLLTQRWKIDHPGLVKLLGYCFDDKKVGAVYSVQPLYTLDCLFDDDRLKWKDRIVVALELARILALLHRKDQQYVVCNLNRAHIMIDKDKKPILYDFSMIHRQVLSGQRAARSLNLIGSNDYIDPYILQTGVMVPQSDIFAFGGLLMSLLCKRDMTIVIRSFIYEHVEEEFKSKSSHVDESFFSHSSYDHHDARQLTKLAMDCLGQDWLLSRPTASEIVQRLQSLSIFSDALVSRKVKVKVVDSHANIERKPSWLKNVRLFKKLSTTHEKRKTKSKTKSSISSDAVTKEKEIIEGPKIFRPKIFENTPEEVRSCMKRIDESLKPEREKAERLRELLKNRVKRIQSNYIKQLVVV